MLLKGLIYLMRRRKVAQVNLKHLKLGHHTHPRWQADPSTHRSTITKYVLHYLYLDVSPGHSGQPSQNVNFKLAYEHISLGTLQSRGLRCPLFIPPLSGTDLSLEVIRGANHAA